VVLLLLPLSLAMNGGEFVHGSGIGSDGGPAAAAAVAGMVVEDNWRQKRQAMRASIAHDHVQESGRWTTQQPII
jgi:hypothetical protein